MTPPTSPTARTCSTTGSGSRTCPRSGGASTEVGLQTTEACGDCPRVVLGSPLAGESLDEVLDPTWAIDEIVAPLHRQPGVLQPAPQVQDRDLGSAGRRPRGQRRRLHRRRSTPSTGRAWTCGSAAACPPTRCSASASAHGCRWTRCPTSGKAVTGVFRDYGYRRLRSKARLKFLIKDWGVEKFRRGPGDRVPQAAADRRTRPGAGDPPDRPRRHSEAEERAQRRRRRPDRRPGVGHHPVQGRRPGRGRRLRPGPLHAVPEADRPRRARRQARRARRGARRARAAVGAVALAAQPDGLHGHRVLQAVVRRDPECARRAWCRNWRSGSRTSTPSSTCRSR